MVCSCQEKEAKEKAPMIKYMVIAYNHNINDEWIDIVESDLHDIEEAEETRSWYLKTYPKWSPDNIQVIQYKE